MRYWWVVVLLSGCGTRLPAPDTPQSALFGTVAATAAIDDGTPGGEAVLYEHMLTVVTPSGAVAYVAVTAEVWEGCLPGDWFDSSTGCATPEAPVVPTAREWLPAGSEV